MGAVCGKSSAAVAPERVGSGIAITETKRTTGINVIWLGANDVPCLSTLRREFNQVYAFDKVSDSIQMIESLSSSTCNCIYIIYDNFKNNEILKTMINEINQLKQICAIYVYRDDEDTLSSYPSICTVTNVSHLTDQLQMITKHLGVLPIVNRSTVKTTQFAGEDVRIEVNENTFNRLLNTLGEMKFVKNNEQVESNDGNTERKDKRTNATWAAEFVISNMNVCLKDSDANTKTNTVNIAFTATVKATVISVNIPLFFTNKEVNPGFSGTSPVEGDAVITFNSKENVFKFQVLKAIVTHIDLRVYVWKNQDVAKWIELKDLPGPVDFSQTVPLSNDDNTTTTDEAKKPQVSIVDFNMRSQDHRIILSLKLDYQLVANKITS